MDFLQYDLGVAVGCILCGRKMQDDGFLHRPGQRPHTSGPPAPPLSPPAPSPPREPRCPAPHHFSSLRPWAYQGTWCHSGTGCPLTASPSSPWPCPGPATPACAAWIFSASVGETRGAAAPPEWAEPRHLGFCPPPPRPHSSSSISPPPRAQRGPGLRVVGSRCEWVWVATRGGYWCLQPP